MTALAHLHSLKDVASSSVKRGQPLYASTALTPPNYLRADGRVVPVSSYPGATDIIPAASTTEVDGLGSVLGTNDDAWNGTYSNNPSPGVAGPSRVHVCWHRSDVNFWYQTSWDARHVGFGENDLNDGGSSAAWLFAYSQERDTVFGLRTGTTLLREAPGLSQANKVYGTSGTLPNPPSPMTGGGAVSATATHVVMFYLNAGGSPKFYTTPYSSLVDGSDPPWTTITSNLPSGNVISRIRYDRVTDSWLATTTAGAVYRTTGITLATWTLVATLPAVSYIDSSLGEWYVWGGVGTQNVYRSTDGGLTFTSWFNYTSSTLLVGIKKYGVTYNYVNTVGQYYQNDGTSTPPAATSFTSTMATSTSWVALMSDRLVIGGLYGPTSPVMASVSAGPALQLPSLLSFNGYDAYLKVTS